MELRGRLQDRRFDFAPEGVDESDSASVKPIYLSPDGVL